MLKFLTYFEDHCIYFIVKVHSAGLRRMDYKNLLTDLVEGKCCLKLKQAFWKNDEDTRRM